MPVTRVKASVEATWQAFLIACRMGAAQRQGHAAALLREFFRSIPDDIIAAARIDGAGGDDRLTLDELAPGSSTLIGGAGDDTIEGAGQANPGQSSWHADLVGRSDHRLGAAAVEPVAQLLDLASRLDDALVRLCVLRPDVAAPPPASRWAACTPWSRSTRHSSTAHSTNSSWTSRCCGSPSPWSSTVPGSPDPTAPATTACGICR